MNSCPLCNMFVVDHLFINPQREKTIRQSHTLSITFLRAICPGNQATYITSSGLKCKETAKRWKTWPREACRAGCYRQECHISSVFKISCAQLAQCKKNKNYSEKMVLGTQRKTAVKTKHVPAYKETTESEQTSPRFWLLIFPVCRNRISPWSCLQSIPLQHFFIQCKRFNLVFLHGHVLERCLLTPFPELPGAREGEASTPPPTKAEEWLTYGWWHWMERGRWPVSYVS